MKRTLVTVLFACVAFVLACDEPLGPRLGSLAINVIVNDSAPGPVVSLTVTGAKADSVVGGTSNVHDDGLSTRGALREGVSKEEDEELSLPAPQRPVLGSMDVMLFDAVTVQLAGPTSKSQSLTREGDSWVGTIRGLQAGSYTVTVLGTTGGAVTWYGQSTGVTVQAARNNTASVTINSFQPANLNPSVTQTIQAQADVSWNAVADATGYDVQWANNSGFSSPRSQSETGTHSTIGPVPDVGTYWVRVRAKNTAVTNGAWSNSVSFDVQGDQTTPPPGNDAASAHDAGFLPDVSLGPNNILPASDQDWFGLAVCHEDTIVVQTFAKQLPAPNGPSDLNTYLRVFHESDTSVPVAENDDFGGSTDSRIDRYVVQTTGVHYVVVSGTGGTVGPYSVDIVTHPGGGNSGTDCSLEPPAWVTVAPSGLTVNVGATAGLTATAHGSDGRVLSGWAFNWTSLNPNIAVPVGNDGTFSGVLHGQTTVAAEADGVLGYGLVTVVQPTAGSPPNVFGVDQAAVDAGFTYAVGIWAGGSNDVYAARSGQVGHFDGATWTVTTLPRDTGLYGPWGTATNDMWTVGYGGAILHFNGTDWQEVTSPTTENLIDVWGSAPHDVYAVGGNGTVVHYDGAGWSTIDVGAGATLLAGVWGSAHDDIFVVGDAKTVLHFDGSQWHPMAVPGSVADTVLFRDVWGTGAGNVYAVGGDGSGTPSDGIVIRWDGNTWSEEESGTDTYLLGVWGMSEGEVYALGAFSTFSYSNGTAWSPLMSGGTGYGTIRAAWSSAPDAEIVAVGGSVLRGYRGASVVVNNPTIGLGTAGDTATVLAEARDAFDTPIPNVSFSFTSDNEGVATIDPGSGLVTAVAEGTATITVTAAGGASTTVDVIVSSGPSQLAFTTLPSSVDPRAPFAVVVEVRDASGQVVDTITDQVTLAFEANPGSKILHAGGNTTERFLQMLDPTTPALLEVLPNAPAPGLHSMVLDPLTGLVYARGFEAAPVSQASILAIDPRTGVSMTLSTGAPRIWGMIIDGTGRLLGVRSDAPELHEIDRSTGALTLVGSFASLPAGTGFGGMAVDPMSGTVYATYRPDGITGPLTDLVTVDLDALTVQAVGTLSEDFVGNIQFLGDGTLVGTTPPNRLWTIDEATGVMTIRSGLRPQQPEVAGTAIAALPAELGGTLGVNAVSGVATFSDLEIDIPANGYTLRATLVYNGGADTLTATSDPLEVVPGVYQPWPADLVFQSLPSSVNPTADFPAEVAVVDVFGNVVDTSTAPVTLEYDVNAGSMLLRWSGFSPPYFTRTDYLTPQELGPVTGSLTSAGDLQALVYDPSSGLVLASGSDGATGAHLMSVNPVDGAMAVISSSPTPDLLKGLAWVGDSLWGVAAWANNIYKIDPATGTFTLMGSATGATVNNFHGLVTDPTDGTVYAVTRATGSGQVRDLVTIDPSTLVATKIGTLPIDGVSTLAILPDGTLIAGTGTGAVPFSERLWFVDKTTANMIPFFRQTPFNGNAITTVPAWLGGNLLQSASSGVATFGDLNIDAPASGYRLRARSYGIADAVSEPITVNPGSTTEDRLFVTTNPDGGVITGIGDTLHFQADVWTYVGGTHYPIMGEPVYWWSTDSAVAIPDQNGIVTAVGAGSAAIVASDTGGVAVPGVAVVTVDPSFTGTISASSAGFADQLTLTPGPGVTWDGDEWVTIGGELPYIESQDASQIVLRVPSVAIGDAAVAIGNQGVSGYTQYAAIEVTSTFVRNGDPATAPDLLNGWVPGDTTFYVSFADSMWSAPSPTPYHNSMLSPTQSVALTIVVDWQTSDDLAFGILHPVTFSCIDCSGDTGANPESTTVAIPADSTWMLAIAGWGVPQTMARVRITSSMPVGTSVTVGYDHSCVLDHLGNAYCWGANGSGQLGDGYTVTYTTLPVAVTGGLHFKTIAAGSFFTCALDESGAAYCWGSGPMGTGSAPAGGTEAFVSPAALAARQDDPTVTPEDYSVRDLQLDRPELTGPSMAPMSPTGNSPTPVIGGHSFKQIVGGWSHVCGVTTADEAYCWGSNTYGQIGDGTNDWAYAPTPVSGSIPFVKLAAGDSHTCGITSAGTAYCWGANWYGQLGNNVEGVHYSAPQLVLGGIAFSDIVAGSSFTCGLTAAGATYCWGPNWEGQLGIGSFGGPDILLPSTPVAGGLTFTRVFAGFSGNSACGLTAAHQTYCWGAGYEGQLGDGTRNSYHTPTLNTTGLPFQTLSLGPHTCGATITGEVFCWGRQDAGEIGDGSVLPKYGTVTGLTGISAVDVGEQHSCAIDGFGNVYCWGNGYLGDGNYYDATVPVPASVAATVQSISTGNRFSCAITTGNSAYCWGYNTFGNLGVGDLSIRATPALVGSFAQISAGKYYSTCGIDLSGNAYCWGLNTYGQLGKGSTGGRDSLPVSVNTTLTFQRIAVGRYHACALTSASGGDVWCWGYNNFGQLGDGANVQQASPVQVQASGVQFTSLTAGNYHTCAKATTGDTYCWGYGYHGEIGNGQWGAYNTPQLVLGSEVFVQVDGGSYTNCGAASDGTGYCWGYSDRGQAGTGSLMTQYPTPVSNYSGSSFSSVAAGSVHSCGVLTTGGVECWGQNLFGELGTGTRTEYLWPAQVVGGIVARTPPAAFSPVEGSSTTQQLLIRR